MSMNTVNQLQEKEILFILCIEVALMMLGIGLVSPILPQYASTFGINMTMVGLIITAFGIARIFVDIPRRINEQMGKKTGLNHGPLDPGDKLYRLWTCRQLWDAPLFSLHPRDRLGHVHNGRHRHARRYQYPRQ